MTWLDCHSQVKHSKVPDDDTQGFVPGPLDELVPGLRQRGERLPSLVVHPKVCRARDPDGREAVVIASFKAPDSARALVQALKPIVEAVLLHELTQPQDVLMEQPAFSGMDLYLFHAASFDPAEALSLLGFTQAPYPAPECRAGLALLRREAQLVSDGPTGDPVLRFSARFAAADSLAARAEAKMRSYAPLGPWGMEPGVLARRLADVLKALGHDGVEPTRAGIERLENALETDAFFAIRAIPPLCFQGLCDLVAVAAHAAYGCEVQWGVCERDPETNLAPPPLIRVSGRNGDGHVPLGEHILRWCVMPKRPGEDIPSLGSWAEHEFGP